MSPVSAYVARFDRKATQSIYHAPLRPSTAVLPVADQ
jgi:hypothetical protein